MNRDDRLKSNGAGRVLSVLQRNRKQQEVLYRTLLHCEVLRAYDEVETYVSEQPEMVYGQILQAPRTLIGFLTDAGGIAQVDDQGVPFACEGENYSSGDCFLSTTDEGIAAARAFCPLERLESLVSLKPTRKEAFLLFLEACLEPQAFSTLESFCNEEVRRRCFGSDGDVLEADYFVSQLEKAGGLVWKKAWVTTEEGKRFADQVRRVPEKKI